MSFLDFDMRVDKRAPSEHAVFGLSSPFFSVGLGETWPTLRRGFLPQIQRFWQFEAALWFLLSVSFSVGIFAHGLPHRSGFLSVAILSTADIFVNPGMLVDRRLPWLVSPPVGPSTAGDFRQPVLETPTVSHRQGVREAAAPVFWNCAVEVMRPKGVTVALADNI